MQLFHLGFLYQRPVTVNVIRDGVPTPVPYQRELFDYGRNKIERPLPVNLGFAGFRLHYPAERPEGARRAHRLPRRELFPLPRARTRNTASRRAASRSTWRAARRRSFRISASSGSRCPGPTTTGPSIYALLDSPSVTGAYRFEIYPSQGDDPRRHRHAVPAPADHQCGPRAPHLDVSSRARTTASRTDDFRLELHDSDGLLMQSGAGEWIWRPLRNPGQKTISSFSDNNPRGFGLMQRDRVFENYQDLEAHLPPAARLLGRADRRNGARAGSSWSRSRRRTRPTTTSSPIGSRAGPTSRARRSTISYRLRAVVGDRRACIRAARSSTPSRRRPAPAARTRPSDPTHRRFIDRLRRRRPGLLPRRSGAGAAGALHLGRPDHPHLPDAQPPYRRASAPPST